MTVRVVVDRIEGSMAVLEVGGDTVDWPLSALPGTVREGAVFQVTFAPADTGAQARLDRMEAKGPKGDSIDL